MAKKPQRTKMTHDEAMNFARACLYSDFGAFGEVLASLVVLLLNDRESRDDFLIPTRSERHDEWNRYMAERRERESLG